MVVVASRSASASPQVQVAERETSARAKPGRQARPLAHPDFGALMADLLG